MFRRLRFKEINVMTDRDSVLCREPGIDLDDILGRKDCGIALAGIILTWRYILYYVDDHPVPVYEYHVQRDERILHPESEWLFLLPDEQHPSILIEALPVHQSLLPGHRGVDDIEIDGDISIIRMDCGLRPGLSRTAA